jgi:hypothetical protein
MLARAASLHGTNGLHACMVASAHRELGQVHHLQGLVQLHPWEVRGRAWSPRLLADAGTGARPLFPRGGMHVGKSGRQARITPRLVRATCQAQALQHAMMRKL